MRISVDENYYVHFNIIQTFLICRPRYQEDYN